MSELKLVPLPGARSDIWKKFGFKINDSGVILDNKKVFCRACKNSIAYSGNTSNLNSHLQQCLSVKPKNNTSSIATYFKGPKAKLPLNSKRNKELTKGLIKFIVKDLRPLSIVEGEGFREFLDLGIPEYTAPSRRTISRLIDHAALLERDNFKKYLSNISDISLTIDFWTSDSNNSYLGVTCHFIDSWSLHSRVLEVTEVPESHTSINIVSNLKSVLKTWDIENKVVAFVCDNAANMVKAINDMDKFNLVRCTAHSIQLSVNAGLKNDVTKELINKLRKIVGYFNKSSSAQSELEKEQVKYGESQNKLVQDCVTRWNSTCNMIESVIKHRYSINSVISKNKKTDEWFLTSAEVQNLKDLVNVLEPFKSVTNTLGGDKYVTASVANRLIKSLLNTVQTCETDSNFIKTVKLSILQDLKIRREMMSPVLSKAAALDPRFHELKFISDEQKTLIWEELETEICEMNPQSQEIRNDKNKANEIENVISSDEDNPPPKKMRSLMADSDDEDGFSIGFEIPITASRQLQNYKNMTTKCHRDEDPLKWWKVNSNLYPEVSKLAKKYLSIVATSVPCERLFSEAGNITSKKRSRLSPDRVNNLLFLNSYYKSTKTSDHTLYSLLQAVVEACQKKQQCRVQPSVGKYDPCPGHPKFIQVDYKCRPFEFRSKVACENEVVNLQCNPNSRLAMFSASYGRTEYESIQCPQPQGVPEETCLVSYATETVMTVCHGKRNCRLAADAATFGNPCKPASRMYLKVVYNCVPRRVLKEQFEEPAHSDEPTVMELDYFDNPGVAPVQPFESLSHPANDPRTRYNDSTADPVGHENSSSSSLGTISRHTYQQSTSNPVQNITTIKTADPNTVLANIVTFGYISYKIVYKKQDKFYLYLGGGLIGGLLSILCVVAAKYVWQRSRRHLDNKHKSDNTSHDMSIDPNAFGDNISEVDADIDLTDITQFPITVIPTQQLSPSEVVRYGNEGIAPKSLCRNDSSQYYYG